MAKPAASHGRFRGQCFSGAIRLISSGLLTATFLTAQSPALDVGASFRLLAAQISAARTAGDDEPEAVHEQALAMLDRVALEHLNGPAADDLDALNSVLAGFVTRQPPVGEGYRLYRLDGTPPVFALLVNFGLSGPSAVRLYAGAAGQAALVARVDRFAQPGFLDDYMELIPLAGPVPLFVTVAGRTDDLQTGIFTVWRFDGRGVESVWESDILQQSSYEAGSDGFRLTYCAESDPADFRTCRRMVRDRYLWQDGSWVRVESAVLP